MKSGLFALSAVLALSAAPAAAATNNPPPPVREEPPMETLAEEPDFAALGDILGGLFGPQAEPLTPEAEARLPLAQEVSDSLFPAGTFQKVLEGTYGDMFGGLMNLAASRPNDTVAKLTGLYEDELNSYDDDTLSKVALALDPSYVERKKMEGEAITGWIGTMMNDAEPIFRDGYARAFASRFDEQQLSDLKAFFLTPSGAFFASQFVLIGTDPQVMGKMKEAMPVMLNSLPAAIQASKDAMAALPAERYFDELKPREQKQIAALLGYSVEDLAASAAASREAEQGKDDWESYDPDAEGAADTETDGFLEEVE